MKFGIVILFLLLSKITLATDTLKFGDKSYPLKKVPTYFNTYDYENKFPVQLLKYNLLSL